MKKGDSIIIREIHNGVEIFPYVRPDECRVNKEIIAFQSADDFIKWIKCHFSVYEQPSWSD
jgi:hypothetical protein